MKNNKGFSLVELIIVIAIMAILVGVMAPQLIRYIEKTKESSDIQLLDTVRSAVTTAVMDPSVVTTDYVPADTTLSELMGVEAVGDAVKETLGGDADYVKGQLKSEKGLAATSIDISFDENNGNKVTVTAGELSVPAATATGE